MKKGFLFILIFLCCKVICGQGLENIIVEKYYIAEKSDTAYGGENSLAAGSVTYRIFVDMKPGYNLQSVYGAPGHELKLKTTSYFFNHPGRGNNIPNLIAEESLNDDIVMLDSWIGMGGGSQMQYAVLKTDDDTIATIHNEHKPLLLQNKNPNAGISLNTRDGLKSLESLPPRVTQVGLDTLLLILDKKNTPGYGYVFSTFNGGWGCIGGATGADSLSNRVCIGQFTTDGDFNFEFNVQIGSPETGVEQYVTSDPKGSEQYFKGLVIAEIADNNRKSRRKK